MVGGGGREVVECVSPPPLLSLCVLTSPLRSGRPAASPLPISPGDLSVSSDFSQWQWGIRGFPAWTLPPPIAAWGLAAAGCPHPRSSRITGAPLSILGSITSSPTPAPLLDISHQHLRTAVLKLVSQEITGELGSSSHLRGSRLTGCGLQDFSELQGIPLWSQLEV